MTTPKTVTPEEPEAPLPVAVLLSRVMDDVGAVSKTERNNAQGAGYNFRGVDAVVNAVSPMLRKHGVIVVPRLVSERREVIVTRSGSPMNYVAVNVEYTYYGPAGDSITGGSIGAAFDSGDKAEPKAMSVAYRVFLLQSLCLPTDDREVDADSHEMGRTQDRTPPNDPAAEEWVAKIREAMLAGVDQLIAVAAEAAGAHAMNLVWEGKTIAKYNDDALLYATRQAQKNKTVDTATGEVG